MQKNPRRLFKALYETLPVPVVVADLDRVIRDANAATYDMFGYADGELIGQLTSVLYVDPDVPSRLRAQALGVATPGSERLIVDAVFRRKDGSAFEGQVAVNVILDDDGAPEGFVGIIQDLTAVRASQTERLRIEQILSGALASIKEGFAIYDADDRLVLCNDAYRDIYAVSAAMLVPGTRFEDIIRYGVDNGQYPKAGTTPESREAWFQARMAAHADPRDAIVQQVGAERWVQVEERRMDNGFRVGIRTDISGLLKMRSETERLGTILETVSQEIYVIDPQTWLLRSANRQARDHLGYANGEIAALRFTAFNLPANGLSAETMIAAGRETGQRFATYQAVQRRKDGTHYPCQVRMELIGEEGDESLVAFVEDTSERVAIESQLARKAQEYESLVRNLPDAISRSRPDTTLTYVNDIYVRFMGKSEEELIGTRFADFIPETHREAALQQIAELTPEQPMRTFEQPTIDHAGREHLYLWSNLMTFRNGKAEEILSVGRDITEQRDARERIEQQARELEQRNAALEQFTGIVTHDLKAPLRHIRSFTEMMIEDIGAGNTADLEVYGQHIGNGVRRMERIISSLHEFSQVAYKTIRPQAFGLKEAVDAASEALSSLIADRGARLELKSSVAVKGDFELIAQLLQNLIGNAIKYVAPGVTPKVEIDGARTAAGIEIRVCDNGIGIPAEQAENVFAIFRRLHRDETAYAGDGIGLALCRRIVEAHGGTIGLDTGYGPGCRFVIRLPATS